MNTFIPKNDILRLLLNLIRIGTVAEVDLDADTCRVTGLNIIAVPRPSHMSEPGYRCSLPLSTISGELISVTPRALAVSFTAVVKFTT